MNLWWLLWTYSCYHTSSSKYPIKWRIRTFFLKIHNNTKCGELCWLTNHCVTVDSFSSMSYCAIHCQFSTQSPIFFLNLRVFQPPLFSLYLTSPRVTSDFTQFQSCYCRIIESSSVVVKILTTLSCVNCMALLWKHATDLMLISSI